MARMVLSKKQMENVKQFQKLDCPECGTSMALFPRDPQQNPHAAKKPEFYCGKCHLSAPMF